MNIFSIKQFIATFTLDLRDNDMASPCNFWGNYLAK